ncbi:hypothetical protein [Kitasatospora sp. CB01950]|uniref:hypothetical protein n=1 Tax=Kitasatospora sp. CB01950 TaxID=1703930 RepID=UPI00093DE272|nr:hypothetical protein [Kitasatospora sp. CB01950]OKJ17277.1 hypothetical protein AMK19_04175 [Kitasatospora sp. CB01950]
MRANRLPAAIALTVLAMAGMTACGSDDHSGSNAQNGLAGLSGQEILAKTKAAGDKAPSVRMTFRMEQGGSTDLITASVARSGDCATEIAGGDPVEEGASGQLQQIHIVRKGEQSWMKMESSRSTGGAADKWMTGRGRSADQMNSYCELALTMPQTLGDMAGANRTGEWISEGSTRINGVPAVILRFVAGDPADELALVPEADTGSAMRIAVATEGEPYLLRAELTVRGDKATILFRDYGAPVTVTPPPADQVQDLGDDPADSEDAGGDFEG